MKLSLDQTTDYSFRELHKFLKKADHVPAYVTEFTDSTDYSSLPKEAFADQYNRAFPKNTKEATYLSYMHFVNKKASLNQKYNASYVNEVEGRLKKSAALFDITADLEAYTNSFNTKEAGDYSEKTVFEKELNGVNYPLFTYKTAGELKLAAEQFANGYQRIPFEWRQEVATNFLKHAQAMNLDELPDIICKYAEIFYPDANAVVSELSRRASHTKKAENKETYQKLADSVEGLDDNKYFMKIAEVCYWMERAEGLYDNKKTAATLGDPVNMIYTLSVEKVAAELDVVKLGNEYFKLSDLQEITPEVYKQAFGVDLDNNDSDNLREVLPTMPLSDVALLQELSGLRPV